MLRQGEPQDGLRVDSGAGSRMRLSRRSPGSRSIADWPPTPGSRCGMVLPSVRRGHLRTAPRWPGTVRSIGAAVQRIGHCDLRSGLVAATTSGPAVSGVASSAGGGRRCNPALATRRWPGDERCGTLQSWHRRRRRTTRLNVQGGKTPDPRFSTLARLAEALGVELNPCSNRPAVATRYPALQLDLPLQNRGHGVLNRQDGLFSWGS